jgi:hypothetical protein
MSVQERLEYLRQELRAERISMGELHELQGLADQIEPGDVELLEAAGVPEFEETPAEHPTSKIARLLADGLITVDEALEMAYRQGATDARATSAQG